MFPLRTALLLLAAASVTVPPTSAHAQSTAAVVAAGPFSMPPSSDTIAYTPSLAFDVISIRESERGRSLNMGVLSPPHTGQFDASSITLPILIHIAFGSGPFKISDGPDWFNDRYFRVQARCDHSVDDQLAKLSDDQARLEKLHMLQAMLADRFHLKAHWETHDGSVYNMTVAKGGLKMQQTPVPSSQPAGPDGDASKPLATGPGVHASGGPQGIQIDGDHFSMRAMTTFFGTQLSTPIVDRTGLPATDTYSFRLQFAREGASSDADAYPSLPTAAQEQLGLRLDSAKGPVDVLVIEHIYPPTLN